MRYAKMKAVTRVAVISHLSMGVALVLAAACSPTADERIAHVARFSELRLDMTRTDLLEAAGAPDQECEGSESVKLLRGQIRGELLAVREGKRERALRNATREILVYFLPSNSSVSREVPCGPNYLDTAVGLDSTGRVLWYTVLRGEDYVVHSDI